MVKKKDNELNSVPCSKCGACLDECVFGAISLSNLIGNL